MNKNNVEVELKYQIRNQKKLEGWLKKNAKQIFSSRQVDEYYTPAHENYFKEKRPTKYLRIRKSGNGWSTAFKLWHPSGKGEYSHCDEFETDIDSGEELKKIFIALGFKVRIVVDKKRTTYNYRDFKIEIDKIEELGTVCEIEMKRGFNIPEEGINKIKEFATELGLTEEDRGDDLKLGYAYLIAKKKGIVK